MQFVALNEPYKQHLEKALLSGICNTVAACIRIKEAMALEEYQT